MPPVASTAGGSARTRRRTGLALAGRPAPRGPEHHARAGAGGPEPHRTDLRISAKYAPQSCADDIQATRDRLAAYLRESATVTQQQAEGLNALADYVSSLDDNDGAIRRLTEIRLAGNPHVAD